MPDLARDAVHRALAGQAHERLDVVARLASKAVGSSVGLVSVVGREGQTFPGAVGLPEPWQGRRQTPLSHSFCQHVVATGEDLVIDDARTDALVASNLAIRDLGVIAYAGVPLRDATGELIGSVCAIDGHPREWEEADLAVLRDAARLATSELELITLREQALASAPSAGGASSTAGVQVLNRVLDELSGTVQQARADQIRGARTLAHELATPLAAVRMLTEDLLSELAGTPQARAVEQIASCTREAADLLDAQTVQSLSSWRTPKHEEDVDLADLLGSLEVMLTPLAPPGIALRVDVPSRATRTLTTDPVKLSQVLRNLVSNALRLTDRGEVALTTRRVGSDLELAVTDTGPGVPPELVDRIFDEYTSGPRPGSFGLGLPLSRSIMRDLGGELTVRNLPAGGCAFVATLPARIYDARPAPARPQDPVGAYGGSVDRGAT